MLNCEKWAHESVCVRGRDTCGARLEAWDGGEEIGVVLSERENEMRCCYVDAAFACSLMFCCPLLNAILTFVLFSHLVSSANVFLTPHFHYSILNSINIMKILS